MACIASNCACDGGIRRRQLWPLVLAVAVTFAPQPSARGQATNVAADLDLANALQTANTNLLKSAMARGANVNRAGTNGLTPVLQLVAGRTAPLSVEERQCLVLLVEHGANPDALDLDERNPLIHAARAGDLETVKLLVETGNVYVRTRDRFHTTALLYAARAHNRPIVLYLASNGDIQSPTVRERRERGRR